MTLRWPSGGHCRGGRIYILEKYQFYLFFIFFILLLFFYLFNFYSYTIRKYEFYLFSISFLFFYIFNLVSPPPPSPTQDDYYYRNSTYIYIRRNQFRLFILFYPNLNHPNKTFRHCRQTTKIKHSKDSALDFYLRNRLSMYVLNYVIIHPSSSHPHLQYHLSYQKKRVS